MSRVVLGRTAISAEKNAFGALPVQRVGEQEAIRLLRKALDGGMDFFDTARAYSDSEEKIGLALADVREKITIATKTTAKTAEQFWTDLETSLRLMKTDHVDIYQFHMAGACYRPGEENGLYDAMLKAREQGKIRFIGITAHKSHIAEEAVRSGLYDTLQFPLSYLSSEKDMALAKLCAEKNVGFIAMKALSGGLITNARAACAWMNTQENALPIWGIQREAELDEFLAFMKDAPELDDELRAAIEKDRAELMGNFCRGCGYCMPCPVDIEIFNAARMIQMIRRSPSAGWLSEKGQAMMRKINDCIECGQCARQCPYELDTPALLKENLADYENILAGRVTV